MKSGILHGRRARWIGAFDTYSTGGANVHWLRPLLPGIWLSMLTLIYTSHSAATTAWAFVGAILILLAVGWYIRMNLT